MRVTGRVRVADHGKAPLPDVRDAAVSAGGYAKGGQVVGLRAKREHG